MWDNFKLMYQMLWDLIYDLLAMFGIEKDENGNLVKKEEDAE